MRPGIVIIGLWIAWALSWLIASGWSSPAAKRASPMSEVAYRVPMVIGALLLFVPAHGYEGPLRVWHIGWVGAWLSVAVMVAGFAFCWWARIHLGKLWSGSVTTKADHRVVDSGPYGIVRHPIYTGLIIAFLGTAAAKGTLLGLAGTAAMILGVWMKARLEEGWLSEQLGPEAYQGYRRRVPMLIPFGPRSK